MISCERGKFLTDDISNVENVFLNEYKKLKQEKVIEIKVDLKRQSLDFFLNIQILIEDLRWDGNLTLCTLFNHPHIHIFISISLHGHKTYTLDVNLEVRYPI